LPIYALERLLFDGWGTQGSSIELNDRLAVEDLGDAVFLHNARTFLAAMAAEGGVRATPKGRLNRAFVEQMIQQLDLPADYVARKRDYRKVINERDLFPLHILRLVTEMAGLVLRQKGRFQITQMAERLLGDDRAGALYALLFGTVFRHFDLGLLDRIPAGETFQRTFGVGLWVVGAYGSEWRTAAALAPAIGADIVLLEFVEDERDDRPVRMLEIRFLEPLTWFGLLQVRETREPEHGITLNEYRKTELFDRFLRITTSDAWVAPHPGDTVH